MTFTLEREAPSLFYIQLRQAFYRVEFKETPLDPATLYDFVWSANNLPIETAHTIIHWCCPGQGELLELAVCLRHTTVEDARLALKSYRVVIMISQVQGDAIVYNSNNLIFQAN